MINHEYKCIFIHIPRCGGTSIEAMFNIDMWAYDKGKTKHLIASTAKELYKDYWNSYFKFSIVRNPWDRMVSMRKHHYYYGVNSHSGTIDVSGYIDKFSPREIDTRSLSMDDKFSAPIPNAVYANILNEPLDYVGKFEELQHSIDTICDRINKPRELLPLIQKSNNRGHYRQYYDNTSRDVVEQLYLKDIAKYKYTFECSDEI